MAGRRGARTGRGWDAAPSARTGGSGSGRSRRGRAGDPAAASGQGAGAGRWPGRGGGPGEAPGSGDGADEAPAPKPRDEAEAAREICLRQLAVRPRTRAELATAMARRGISTEVAAEVLDRYDEVGIIDDAAFARAWVSSRHQGRGLARRALANELRQRGVDAEIATEALGELDESTEAQTARQLVDRKLRTVTGSPEAVFRRLVGMLARKGYPPGVAIRAVKDALAERDAEAAEFADQIDADALAESGAEPDRDAI
ncbi:regulatory protein RecX [Micromonospora sp. WMMD1102]|uniref:regulatory protein RecX n=1 Tax=Micromonospora sp. WMMD1102 TaxID=3016105 RepID=UPI0024156C0E|nr:regulatory protein RecX [Micromonospora sp. WMMD1102]MDG4785770.1 regulatory protein RecX [Micromonospora sp. WMMD1102]